MYNNELILSESNILLFCMNIWYKADICRFLTNHRRAVWSLFSSLSGDRTNPAICKKHSTQKMLPSND